METRAIYTRKKENNWKYVGIEGIGTKGKNWSNSKEPGPFFINVIINGQQKYLVLNRDGSVVPKSEMDGNACTSIPEAIKAANLYDEKQKTKNQAKAQGLTVADPGDGTRITLRTAVDHFIQEKQDADRAQSTIEDYRRVLEEFLTLLPSHVRFVDQMVETQTKDGIPKRTSSALKDYMKQLKESGNSARTINNKVDVVTFMLKEAGIKQPSKLVTKPEYQDEEAVAYTRADLKKLFAVMDPDDKFLYCFFLDSACRKGEVAHAMWKDVYDGKYHVRGKTFKFKSGEPGEFRVKTHEDRRVPLTDELLRMIEERRNDGEKLSQWIFPNNVGDPDNDNGFIRQLKRIAKKAGLICGQCHTELKKTDRYGLNPRQVDVCCADDCQVCEQHYLHKFRKTRATHWHNTGVPIRTIQKWLGHKSLETTMIYLGVKDTEELKEQINAPIF